MVQEGGQRDWGLFGRLNADNTCMHVRCRCSVISSIFGDVYMVVGTYYCTELYTLRLGLGLVL